MPNWCENNFQITGPADDIRRFVTEIHDVNEETFELAKTLMPMPEILNGTKAPNDDEESQKEAISATGFPDWYEWANSDTNWGTKWGDCDTDLWFDDEQIRGYYQTAWSPLSVSFWKHVSARYPSLKIAVEYREDGMCYEGAYAFYGGDCHYDHSQDTGQLWKQALETLDCIKVNAQGTCKHL